MSEGECLMADMVCLSASPSAKQAPVSHTHTDALALIWLLLAAGQATPITAVVKAGQPPPTPRPGSLNLCVLAATDQSR